MRVTRRLGAVAAAGLFVAVAVPPAWGRSAAPEFVLSPEGNRLWAYDAVSGEAQLVIEAVNGAGDPDAQAPPGSDRRDINGQVCVSPDGRHLIAGEDTVVASGEGGQGGDGGSSHDPRIAGWGYFTVSGAELGGITVQQVGKLAPEAGRGAGYAGDPDNFGCGFLDRRRVFTTALGNTLPGQEVNGQLFLWFGPFDRRYREVTTDGVRFYVGEVDHCEIDRTLATAGGIAVDRNGDVYVATNRPDDQGNPGSVWRYSGRWPASFEQCTPEYLQANITKERVLPLVGGLPFDPIAPTPSAVVISPDDTLYVSSVFAGTVSEFRKDGTFVRDVWPSSPVAPRTGPTSQTPFGLAVTSDGALWIADLGIVLAAPAPGEGSVIRVPFVSGMPQPLGETIADGLDFPDGLGVYRPVAVPDPDPPPLERPPPDVPDGGPPLPATGGGVVLAGTLLAVVAAWLRDRSRHAPARRRTGADAR